MTQIVQCIEVLIKGRAAATAEVFVYSVPSGYRFCPLSSPGVNGGAVMGTVGGIAIILAVAWLILHSRRRRLRKEHWSVAQPPIYSVSSFKEPLSQAGTGQLGNYNPAQVCPSRHKDHKRHHSGQLNGNAGAAARADVEPVVDAGRGAMVLGFTGDDLQAGLSDLKHIITNRLLPAVDASKLTIGEATG